MIIEKSVGSDSDDCYKGGTFLYRLTELLNMGLFGGLSFDIGVRFTGITIPAGATISVAHLKFYAHDDALDTTCNLKIDAEQTNGADTFSTVEDFDARVKTTENAEWNNVPSWSKDNVYNSIDFRNVIQELVDDYGGLDGADIAIFVSENGSDNDVTRVANGYTHGNPVVLRIETYMGKSGPLPLHFNL